MAIAKNTLATRKPAAPAAPQNKIAKFMAGGMEVQLTPEIVRNYLVSGDKDRVTMQEVAMFINLCKYSGLNPWLREAYCIKYGTEPATMVVGKDAFMKRAENHPQYDGMDAGIIVLNESGYEYRRGTFYEEDEKIVGGWAEVWRKDRSHSFRTEVGLNEYAGRKKDGSMNGQWSKKPATMIRKVAMVQALREAFPAALGALYTAEEVNAEEPEGMIAPIIEPETGEILNVTTAKEEPAEAPAPQPATPAEEDPLAGI